MFSKSISLCAAVIALSAGTASAQSLTGNVGSAGVTDGEHGIEGRIGIDDENNAGARVHYDHSFSDWYQLRLIGSFSQPDGEDWDFSAFTVENWFQWSEEADDNSGFNGGFRFAYAFADDGGPEEAEVRLTATDKFSDGWEWRGNLIGEMEAGDGSEGGVSIEARAQISRAINVNALGTTDWRWGLEYFSELGNTRDIPDLEDQAHQIGPVVKIGWDNGVFVQSAIRIGLTDRSDDTMAKFFIGREF
ncbi:MAG: hypothetical protein AAFY10_11145 [Pseudomonadota bacterium]